MIIDVLKKISEEAYEDPSKILSSPSNTSSSLLDEVAASHPRTLCLSWRMFQKSNEQISNI